MLAKHPKPRREPSKDNASNTVQRAARTRIFICMALMCAFAQLDVQILSIFGQLELALIARAVLHNVFQGIVELKPLDTFVHHAILCFLKPENI